MPAEAMRSFLPVDWLAPQMIEGGGIASFCVLDLRGLTVAPLPPTIGIDSVSSAPRYAVLDTARAREPAVFVTERTTSSALGSFVTSLGFAATHRFADARIERHADDVLVTVDSPDGEAPFVARVASGVPATSQSFADVAAFRSFVTAGVRSYGTSRHPHRLTIVDLYKDDADYEPLAVASITGPLVERWHAAGAVFDSAFRTGGGRYEWKYHGLRDA